MKFFSKLPVPYASWKCLHMTCLLTANNRYQLFFKYLLGVTWPELLLMQKTFLVCIPTPQVASPLQLTVALSAVTSASSEQELQGEASQKKCTHGWSLQARCSWRARSGGQAFPPEKGQENIIFYLVACGKMEKYKKKLGLLNIFFPPHLK